MRTAVIAAPSRFGADLAMALGADPLDFEEPMPPRVDGVVIIVGGALIPAPSELQHTPAPMWISTTENVLRGTMHTLQRAHAALRPSGGRVVLITPTIGMTGCAGLVAYTTAIEGVRAMAKSAARQWGAEAVNVNLVAVPLHVIQPELAYLANHLTPPALGATSAVIPAVVSSVQLLLSPAAAGLAGSTIVCDGGSVMGP